MVNWNRYLKREQSIKTLLNLNFIDTSLIEDLELEAEFTSLADVFCSNPIICLLSKTIAKLHYQQRTKTFI